MAPKPKIVRKGLSIEVKLEIVKKFEKGTKVNALAREYGVNHSTISTILKNKKSIKYFFEIFYERSFYESRGCSVGRKKKNFFIVRKKKFQLKKIRMTFFKSFINIKKKVPALSLHFLNFFPTFSNVVVIGVFGRSRGPMANFNELKISYRL